MQGWVEGFRDAGIHFEFPINHRGENVIAASLAPVLFFLFEEFPGLREMKNITLCTKKPTSLYKLTTGRY